MKITNRVKKELFTALAVVLVDLLSKHLVSEQKFFRGRTIQNPGLPFGIDLPGFFDFYLVLALLLTFVIIFFRNFAKSDLQIALGLILGGALANLIDRLGDRTVTDFIDFGITTVNLADVAIMIGMGFLIKSNVKAQISKI